MAGVEIQPVAYRGSTAILPDLLGGRLNIFFGNIFNVLPLVREGKLRAFAVTSRKRSARRPTCRPWEKRAFRGFEAAPWFGLMAPAGTPQAIVDKMHARDREGAGAAGRAQEARRTGPRRVGNTPAEFAAGDQDRNSAIGQGHQGRRHQGEREVGEAAMTA